MAYGICSIRDCGTFGRLARTWCLTHYERWRQHGTTDDPVPLTPEQRWLAKVDKSGPLPEYRPTLGPCWLWTGEINRDGYGIFVVGERPSADGKRRRIRRVAHRWGYEQFVGPVDDDLDVDHLCRVTACVNYERHLDPTTRQENMLRGFTLGAYNAGKLVCVRGHEFTPETTRLTTRGNRSCVPCEKIREANRPPREWRRVSSRGRRKSA